MESFYVKSLLTSLFICFTLSLLQQPEINDQFVTVTTEEVPERNINFVNLTTTERDDLKVEVTQKETVAPKGEVKEKPQGHRKYFNPYKEVIDANSSPNFIITLYEILTKPIEKFFSSPKVTFVLRNVGTCLVNGAMEIISYYFPAPFIPLIASAAGMVIPFEPVVMLKEKMPVTSYRRAFRKAMNSFLNTFDGYKNDFDDDPYMTRRFNRRFMNEVSEEKKKKE